MSAKRAPLTQETKNTRKYSVDTLLMLFPLVVMAVYYYGERAARLVVISVIAAVIVEVLGGYIVRKKATIGDFDAVVIGVMVPLLLPASSPLWLILVGTVFAVGAVKIPFGNARTVPFDEVSAAIAFLTICSKVYVFKYPQVAIISENMIIEGEKFSEGTSIASMLFQHNSIGTNVVGFLDMWVGNFVGPMGATCGFALFAVAIAMLIRRKNALVASLGFIGVVIIYALLFPRVLTGRAVSVTMELSSGMLIFAALFLLTNPAILPKGTMPRLAFGATAGLLCMLIRTFGNYEEGVCFAILLADSFSTVFDRIKTPSLFSKKKKYTPPAENDFSAIEDAGYIDIDETPLNGGAAK